MVRTVCRGFLKTLFSVTLSIIAASVTLHAFAAEDSDNDWWYTAENQSCQVYFPNAGYESRYSLTWDGACVDGKASGYGRMVHWVVSGGGSSIVTIREGVMRSGKLQGRVILAEANYPSSITICEVRDGSEFSDCAIVGTTEFCEFRNGVSVIFQTCVDADGRPIWREGNAGTAVQEGTGGESDQETGEQPSAGSWITAENQPCQIWNSNPDPGETVTWTGGCVDGKASGTGRLVWRGSYGESVYEGEYRDGNLHGRGTFTWPDGDRYEGEWRDGKTHGHGTYTWPSGTRYEGEYRDGNLHGRGTFTWPDGDRYEGEWRDGKKHGHGTYTWPSGTRYEGEWRDGNMHGHGTKTWPSGTRYEGEWRDDKLHGHGTFTWAEGDRDEGEWRDDKRHGHGTFTWAEGDRDEGVWRDGKKHGLFTETYTGGGGSTCEYLNGELIDCEFY